MLVTLARKLKPLALGIALIAIFAASQQAARADEVTVGGTLTAAWAMCAAQPGQQTAQPRLTGEQLSLQRDHIGRISPSAALRSQAPRTPIIWGPSC